MPIPKNKVRRHPYSKRLLEAEAVFMSIGDGAIRTDEYGKITELNPAICKMLGYKENELITKSYLKTIIAITFEGEKIGVLDRPITQAFLTGKPNNSKFFLLTKKGEHLPVYLNVSPIIIGNKPVGSITLIRDISIEYESDRMKSEFISLASHQLRTPLSAIKTYSHMLDDGYMGKLKDEQKTAIKTIIGATNRMNELISTLLNITKIESGTIAINPKLIRIDEVIKEVLPELHLMADTKLINVSFSCLNKENAKIKTDSFIIKEVVTNLVANAIQYSPEKGKVGIFVNPRKDDILVEITDNGWGIPSKDQSKIFSKFFRGPNVIKKVTSGTGLGLYLVKGLIDTIGGNIWFKSLEGEGTTFSFTLPRKFIISK